MSIDFDRIRAQSTAALAEHGIEVLDTLPRLGSDDVERTRDAHEVAERARTLVHLLAVVNEDSDEARAEIDDAYLTPREREYVSGERAGKDDKTQLSWREEALFALTWALGLADDLPLTGADGTPDSVIEPLASDDQSLRPVEDLAAKLDLFYCAHWAAREHDLSGAFDPWPAGLDPSAILERRQGLEWIFSPDEGWEEISLDT